MLRLLAVNRAAADDGPVFSHTSAAVLWDLPLFGRTADLVHVVTQGRRHTRTEAGVRRHDMEIAEKDIVWRHGLRCTSMVRTVFDLARTLSAEAAVSAADASARTVAVRGRRIDADADSTWREELRSLCSPGLRGVRRARWVSEFADGRAQLPGESVSRLQLDRLGFRDVDLRLPSLPRFRRIRRRGKVPRIRAAHSADDIGRCPRREAQRGRCSRHDRLAPRAVGEPSHPHPGAPGFPIGGVRYSPAWLRLLRPRLRIETLLYGRKPTGVSAIVGGLGKKDGLARLEP